MSTQAKDTGTEYTLENAVDDTAEEVASRILDQKEDGLKGAEVEMEARKNGDLADRQAQEGLFQAIRNISDFEGEGLKLKENNHPVWDAVFSAEIDTDLGLHQLEIAGAPADNIADTLYETRRVIDTVKEAADFQEGYSIEDSSIIDSWSDPGVLDPLSPLKYLDVASDRREFTEAEIEGIDSKITSGPRYDSFREADTDLMTAMAAGFAVHLNSSLPQDMDPDDFARAVYNNIGFQKLGSSMFSNGATLVADGEPIHDGRATFPYDLFGAKGAFARSLDENGEPRTRWEEEVGVALPQNKSYVDVFDIEDGEHAEGVRDVVQKKFEGPIKRIEDLDPELIEAASFEEFDGDLWAQVLHPGDEPNSLADYVEDGYLPVEIHLDDQVIETRYMLPEKPEDAKQEVLNVYEDADTFTRAATDLKANGIAEGRMWSTNLERLNPEILVAQGMINNAVELEEEFRKIFYDGEDGEIDYEQANELGRQIEVQGPEVSREDGKWSAGNEASELDARTAYRTLMPKISEGARKSFECESLPYLMETVIENSNQLEGTTDNFYEMMEQNFDTLEDLFLFQDMAVQGGAAIPGSLEAPEKGSYGAEDYSAQKSEFVDWFVENGLEIPMQHYLDPEVPTGSQEQLEEKGY